MHQRPVLPSLTQYIISPVVAKVPKHAKTIFKLVTVVSDNRTRAKSLFTESEYELHQTYRQLEASEESGGLLGFTNPTDAVVKESLKRISTIFSTNQPCAVAVVKAWNLDPRSIPRKHGTKLAYDYFRIVDLRDVPPLQRPLLPAPSSALTSSRGALDPVLLFSAQPQSSLGPERATTSITTANGGSDFAAAGYRSATDSLAASVAALESRLRTSAGPGLAACAGDPSRPSWNRVLPVSHPPPATALRLYAVVEVMPQGQVKSLYCKDAVFDIKKPYRQVGMSYTTGGLYGFVSVGAALSNEPSVVLQCSVRPLAVAELRTWNLGMSAQLARPAPDKRIGLDFVQVERLMAVPRVGDAPDLLLWPAASGSVASLAP